MIGARTEVLHKPVQMWMAAQTSSAFAACQIASISSSEASSSVWPRARSVSSICLKRRRNLRLVRRSAASGIELVVARQIGDRKQQIADLVFEPVRVGAGRLNLGDLARFLGNLLHHLGRRIPIESDACGALLKLGGTQQCGQGGRHIVQDAGAALGGLFRALPGLVFFPGHGLRFGGIRCLRDRRKHAGDGGSSCR